MAFTKLTSFTKDVSMLADTVTLTASQLKAQFDAAPSELLTYFDNLIDDLEKTTSGDSGAKNLGATPVGSMVGSDVQTILGALDTRMTTAETAPIIQYPTLLNNWVNNDNTYVSHYYKKSNGTVHFYICAKNGSPTLNTVIANLPTGYKPISPMMMRGYSDGGGDIVYHVNTTGEIKFLRNFTYSAPAFIILQGSFQGV